MALLDSGQDGERLLPTWPVTTSGISPASTSSHATGGVLASGIVTRTVGVAGAIADPLGRNQTIDGDGSVVMALLDSGGSTGGTLAQQAATAVHEAGTASTSSWAATTVLTQVTRP